MEAAGVKGTFGGGPSEIHVGETCSKFFLQIFLILFMFASVSYGLFEDQIGKFDWRHQYLGRVRLANFDVRSGGGSSSAVFVATEQNVIAALSLKTGEILWRQVLEEPSGSQAFSKHPVLEVGGSRVLISVSRDMDHFYVRCWEKVKGTMLWEHLIPSDKNCDTSPSLAVTEKEIAVGLACSTAFAFKVSTGEKLWTLDLNSAAGEKKLQWFGSIWEESLGRGVVHLVGGNEKALRIIGVLIDKGSIHANQKVASVSVVPEKCVVMSKSVGCYSSNSMNLVPDLLSPDNVKIISTEGEDFVPISLGKHFALLSPKVVRVFNERGEERFSLNDEVGLGIVIILCSAEGVELDINQSDSTNQHLDMEYLSLAEVSIASAEPFFVVGSVERSGSQNLRWYSLEGQERVDWRSVFPMKPHNAPWDTLFPLVFTKSDGSLSYRVLSVSKDDTLALAQSSGKKVWERPESLASVLAVEMLDLPLSEAQANIEKEFSSDQKESVMTMLMQRLTTQGLQIKRAVLEAGEEILGIAGLLEGLREEKNIHAKKTPSGKFERDYFNLHKVIVLSTGSGKIFGIDNLKGGLLWEIWVPELMPLNSLSQEGEALPIFVQRTTAHFPHPAQCVVLGKNRKNGNGMLIVFDPDSGEIMEKKTLSFPPGQAMLLPFTTDTEIHGLLITSAIDPSMVTVYPNEAVIGEKSTPLYLLRSDRASGELSGWKFQSEAGRGGRSSATGWENRGKMIQTWKVNLPLAEGQILVDIVSQKASEKTHSQGKVMGDRSVLYKYINPNLVVVAALSKSDTSLALSAASSKGLITNSGGLLTLFLVDAVSGRVLFSAQHQQAVGPVHIVNCENWMVYSHWSAKTRRTELSVWELFEGVSQSDGRRFSSLNPTVVEPTVMRQSYVFPQGIRTLTVSNTERGMSNRHLLAAMPFGGILEIPKSFLDPRRVLMPSQEQREEGMIPYIPELPIATEHILNYNQTLLRIRRIHAAPSGLESTSLVLAVGLDLYYTRLNPSGTFDILKDDFDHWLIAAVLAALFLAMIATKRIARHRDLKQAWK